MYVEGGGTDHGIKGIIVSTRMRTAEATVAGEESGMLQQKQRNGLSTVTHIGPVPDGDQACYGLRGKFVSATPKLLVTGTKTAPYFVV